MRSLTYICAFFENRGMLREQQTIWRAYPEEWKRNFHTIVTDDCSPAEHSAKEAYEPVDIASYTLFRNNKKVRWNWLFGRNLGVSVAPTDWVLLTDIDHVVPPSTLKALLLAKRLTGQLELDHKPTTKKSATVVVELDPNFIYRFSRVDAPHPWPWTDEELTPYKPHPNSWLMTRAMFDRMGGYDERFSGFYGSDSDFRERCKTTPQNADTKPAQGVVRLDVPLVRYPREIISDASTTTIQRKAPEDGVNVPRIKAERSQIINWRPLRVTFPYQLEAQCSR